MYMFVYGTLKRNGPNNYVMKNRENGKAEFICEARTAELFPLILTTKYDIPFLLDQDGIGNHVLGEVYAIDDKMLKTLDMFEGYPDFYKRRLVVLKPTNNDQEVISAWVYIFHSFNEKLLKETFYDNYECNNFDVMREISAITTQEERDALFKDLKNGIKN